MSVGAENFYCRLTGNRPAVQHPALPDNAPQSLFFRRSPGRRWSSFTDRDTKIPSRVFFRRSCFFFFRSLPSPDLAAGTTLSGSPLEVFGRTGPMVKSILSPPGQSMPSRRPPQLTGDAVRTVRRHPAVLSWCCCPGPTGRWIHRNGRTPERFSRRGRFAPPNCSGIP